MSMFRISSFGLAICLISSYALASQKREWDDMRENGHEVSSKKIKAEGQFDSAGENLQTATEQASSFQNRIPKDVMQLIFIRASEIGTHPADLASVCKYWHESMRQEKSTLTQAASINTGKDYSNINNFMKDCMHRYWASSIRNMRLTHTDGRKKIKTVMTIPSDADPLNYVFESENPKIFKDVRITTSVDEFFKVNREGATKLVVLASPYAVIKTFHADKFRGIIDKWDPKVAQVGLFWTKSSLGPSRHLDYLVTSSTKKISNFNLWRNWVQAYDSFKEPYGGLPVHGKRSGPTGRALKINFLNSPKNK